MGHVTWGSKNGKSPENKHHSTHARVGRLPGLVQGFDLQKMLTARLQELIYQSRDTTYDQLHSLKIIRCGCRVVLAGFVGGMRWAGGHQQPPNLQSIPQTLLRKLKMKADCVNNLHTNYIEMKSLISGGGATESNAGATTTGSTGFLGPRGPTRHDAPRAPWSPWNASWRARNAPGSRGTRGTASRSRGPRNAWSSTHAGSWDARTTFRHPSVNSTGRTQCSTL